MTKLLRLLRSRKLAAGLLVGLALYSWVVTLVPLESIDAAKVAAWDARHPVLAVVVNALWLHRAYSSPAFIAVAVLLTASTTACAWERTRSALRAWRGRGAVTQAMVERLRRAPSLVVEVGTMDRGRALASAAQALRGMRMRVRQGPVLVAGSSGAVGLLGSPLFHWALVGLFVFAGLAQLTRYEGWTHVLVGESITDVPSGYPQRLDVGLLAGGAFTGLKVSVREVYPDPVVGGVPRGNTPLVALEREGAVLREQMVFANNPLRHGPLLIHSAKTGPAFVGSVRRPWMEDPERVVLYYETGATDPQRFGLPDPTTGAVSVVEVSPAPGGRVHVLVPGGGRAETRTVGVGESVVFQDGSTLTVDALSVYVQLHVVNDWSLPWVYAMFALGCIAPALAVAVAPRTVHVMAVEAADGSDNDPPAGTPGAVRLHVVVGHRKSDPAFPRRVERALHDALAGQVKGSDGEEAVE